jgi:dihydrofolate reductase
MRIVVINHLTLDGVMQARGRPDEDTRGNFTHGGWALAGNDPAMFAAIGARMSAPDSALLLGRRSYDDMLTTWNARGGPFKDGLNNMPKYVASTNPGTQLPWPNSTLLHGDIPAALATLKQRPGGNLVIMGSGALIRSLLPHALIDEFFLMIHPLVLGDGQRLFDQDDQDDREDRPTHLKLSESTATSTGVILATYHPL